MYSYTSYLKIILNFTGAVQEYWKSLIPSFRNLTCRVQPSLGPDANGSLVRYSGTLLKAAIPKTGKPNGAGILQNLKQFRISM